MPPTPFIAYEPPYGGQSLRLGHAEAWRRVERFLAACTDANLAAPARATLAVYEAPLGVHPGWLNPTLEAANRLFGAGTRRAFTSGVRQDFRHEWTLDSDAAASGRAYLQGGEPWPRAEIGPVELTLSYAFRWVDLNTKLPLGGQTADLRAHPQQAVSELLVGLGPRSWVSLSGRFPFPAVDELFLGFLERVAPFMPIRLLEGRFRLWRPTKGPSALGYTQHKIPRGALDGLAQ